MRLLDFLKASVFFMASGSLISCAWRTQTPEAALRIAQSYADLEWMPQAQHIRHGKDKKGVTVHTPDTTLKEYDDDRGWWKPGVPAIGMAYKWGGFDTPETFLHGLEKGKKAGDIANPYKIHHDDAAVSEGSVGVDCSGFVSRCWGLCKPVSTRDLPSISYPVSWKELKMGDILIKPGHVVMFIAQKDNVIVGYESGAFPTWRVRRFAMTLRYMKNGDYSPWRYRNMAAPQGLVDLPLNDIKLCRPDDRL
jgi:hypothetical protein